jgi:hypothetical protein
MRLLVSAVAVSLKAAQHCMPSRVLTAATVTLVLMLCSAVLCYTVALAYECSNCVTDSSTAPYDKQGADCCYYTACAVAIYTAEY